MFRPTLVFGKRIASNQGEIEIHSDISEFHSATLAQRSSFACAQDKPLQLNLWPSSIAAHSITSRPGAIQRVLDIVLEQVPDLIHADGKIRIFHAFHCARPWHIDGDDALDHSRPGAHYRDAVAQH